VATPVDYSSPDSERDVYTIESGDPLFKPKSFEKAPPKRPAPPPPRPQPAASSYPKDLPTSYYEANSESYLRARRVAEMKFNTIKLIIAFVVVSGVMVGVDAFLYPELWWCQWPIGGWAFILIFPILKSFVFRGRDIRSVIEDRLHKMALREVERFDSDLEGTL